MFFFFFFFFLIYFSFRFSSKSPRCENSYAGLILTTLRTDSSVDKLMWFFLFVIPENSIQSRRQFAWNVEFYFLGKIRKQFHNVACKNRWKNTIFTINILTSYHTCLKHFTRSFKYLFIYLILPDESHSVTILITPRSALGPHFLLRLRLNTISANCHGCFIMVYEQQMQ